MTEEEQVTISDALVRYQYLLGKEEIYLKKKLNSLYDFQQLGIRALRRPNF